MTLDDIDELHYIAPIANMRSICEGGILSHSRARQVAHDSVAMQEIQQRRANKVVPLASGGTRALHSYVNLYICARNPMMTRLRGRHREVCVVRVAKSVLQLEGVVVADRNAARQNVRFAAAPEGLALVDRDLVFARYWTHEDGIRQYEHKGIKCAEVLVPDGVPAEHILGAYVSRAESETELWRQLAHFASHLSIEVNPDLFSC